MWERIGEAVVMPPLEQPTLFATLVGCGCLFPYFAVIYAYNQMGFVQDQLGSFPSAMLGSACTCALFCGGFALNYGSLWLCFIGRPFEKCMRPCCCLFTLFWLALFGGICGLSHADSPLHHYWQLSASPLQVSVCSPEWRDSRRGVYFTDGSVSSNGHTFEPFLINIMYCHIIGYNSKQSWHDCDFLVRPVMSCEAGVRGCLKPEPCAWAITYVSKQDDPVLKRDEAENVPVCTYGKQVPPLCGWATSLRRMESRYNGAWNGQEDLDEALQTAAKHFHLNSSSWNLPLLHLEDPKMAAKQLDSWQVWFYLQVLGFVPATVLVMSILCCVERACPRFTDRYLRADEEFSDTEEDD